MKSLVDEIKLMIKPISYFIGGIFLFSIFLALISNDNSNNQVVSNNSDQDSEYMKIMGDIKWGDNVRTWQERMPNCNTSEVLEYIRRSSNNPNSTIDYKGPNVFFYRINNLGLRYSDFMNEYCSLNIGGIKMKVLNMGISGDRVKGLEGLDQFVTTLHIIVLSYDDYYLLKKFLSEKYEWCPPNGSFHSAICSKYTKFNFSVNFSGDNTSIYITPTDLSSKVLDQKIIDLYESTIDIDKVDRDSF